MSQKKLSLKQQKYNYENTCYDASSYEEDYDKEEEDTEDTLEEGDSLLEIETDDEDVSAVIKEEQIEDKPKKRGPKPTKLQYYVDPKEFDKCIIDYYESNEISEDLATMISKIAHKLSYAPNFINYTYRDEMVGDAIVRMMKALISRKYTHSKGYNPFSYFTKIAFNAFRNRIKREKHAHDTLQKYQEEVIMNSDYINFLKNKKTMSSCENLNQSEE